VPLILEYESVLTRPEHLVASGFTRREAVRIVKAFCKMGEPVDIEFRLRPLSRDPNEEFVLETAFHGKAEMIVTFNHQRL
jgi:predicted nucleic acid-binding protein